MPRLELFRFRYRDSRTGKWILARYRAELHEIAARYVEFETVGLPEIREIDRDRQRFSPHGDALQRGHRADGISPRDHFAAARLPQVIDPTSLRGPERFLLLLFLRRYVTYCARRRRFAAMNGAARLHATIMGDVGAG